jgi:uncharacterized membrane protein
VELYAVVVFAHVVGAIFLVGSSFFSPLLGMAARRAGTVESLREWARYFAAVGKLVGPMAGLTLLTGLYLSFAGDWWGSGWLEVSLVMFVLAGVGAFTVVDPTIRRLTEAAEAAPDGPVTADLDALRNDPRSTTVESFMLAGDVAIVFLMTNKPGFAGALVVTAAALVVGAALAARERRHLVAPAVQPPVQPPAAPAV